MANFILETAIGLFKYKYPKKNRKITREKLSNCQSLMQRTDNPFLL